MMETIPTKFRCYRICRSDFMEANLARFRILFPFGRQLVVTIATILDIN